MVIRKEDSRGMTFVGVFLAAGKWPLAFVSLYFRFSNLIFSYSILYTFPMCRDIMLIKLRVWIRQAHHDKENIELNVVYKERRCLQHDVCWCFFIQLIHVRKLSDCDVDKPTKALQIWLVKTPSIGKRVKRSFYRKIYHVFLEKNKLELEFILFQYLILKKLVSIKILLY